MLLKVLRAIVCMVIVPLFLITFLSCKAPFYLKSIKDGQGIETKDMVPKDNEISGWLRDGEMIYCEDLVCLASLIDGAAPYYIESGAAKIIFQDFENSSENIRASLEIYQTKNRSQAQALYMGASAISPVAIERLGESGRIDQGLIGSYRVETYKKNFFIRLVTMDKSEPSKEKIIVFAKKIVSKIP